MSRDTENALLAQLKNPFDPKFVKWRVGATNADKTKGIALAYIDSREVTKRLDDVMGVAGWQSRLTEVKDGFVCEIDLWIGGRWVTRSNAAGTTHVEPIKGGASDAFKRAASTWGVGRYLYYLPNIWVPIVPQGKSYALAEVPELPEWAKPGRVERWEDVAEMEATVESGEDAETIATMVIENIDRIRNAASLEELEAVEMGMDAADKLLLVNEINTKKRSLMHEGNIHSDSRQPSAA